ncbi:hypothetical protein [Mesorhizobium sp. CN2-181]|uniref:hypothetical protein n=1 Tax=Mesorhizobium yinganensis TaxID=3157707 RepID=UPI0032B881C8
MAQSPSEPIEEMFQNLRTAVGECILEWAVVEFHLALMFHTLIGGNPPVSHGVFGAIRSFEARLQMLHMAVVNSYTDEADTIRTDWKLLYNYCTSMSQLRNQVAHATALNVDGKEVVLEPFFNLTKEREKISTAEIKDRSVRFRELATTLWWITDQMERRTMPLGGSARPVPDLLLRLRTEAAQRRAKHGRPP